MADLEKYSPQYTLRKKRKRYGRGVVELETESRELRFSQLQIHHCPMSIVAFEFPILEIDFVLSEFEFKVFI